MASGQAPGILLAGLDRLEDYRVRTPKHGDYERVIHPTAFGPAWFYLYNREVAGCPVIREGPGGPDNPTAVV